MASSSKSSKNPPSRVLKKESASSSSDTTSMLDRQRRKKRTISGILFFILSAITGLSLVHTAGVAGEFLLKIIRFLSGVGIYILPFIFLWLAIHQLRHRDTRSHWIVIVGGILSTLAFLGLCETTEKLVGTGRFLGGGILGEAPSSLLIHFFDPTLTIVILIGALLIGIVLMFGMSFDIERLLTKIREINLRALLPQRKERDASEEDIAVKVTSDEGQVSEVTLSTEKESRKEKGEEKEIEKEKEKEKNIERDVQQKKPESSESVTLASMPVRMNVYTPPPLSLLSKTKSAGGVNNVKEVAEIIAHTLRNFNIEVIMDEITQGPSVTRYAMKPAIGTKLSRISSLENELSLALAAHPIRIEAPIPGKSLVGIEIPNENKTMVGLGSMLNESEFITTKKPLLVSIGKTVAGTALFANIATMPHALIAGTTGSGKSVMVHNLIVSLLYGHGPEEVRMIMIDPKRVELTLYDGIPHLLTPVIKDAKKALLALKWATAEMDRRYNVLEEFKVRDIGSYHTSIVQPAYTTFTAETKNLSPEDIDERAQHLPERMPYIVIVIDEMADLMQLYPRELEAAIVRLAQMSRAVGIHLILSTQRPSVNVITGLIKANIPTRIALKVSSQIDSRTILDSAGAETLLGRGDMLYRAGDMPEPLRVQCANIPEEEIRALAQYIIKHNKSEVPDMIELPDTVDEDKSIASGTFDDNNADDALFEEVKNMVISSGKASTSYIQRKFRIGYSRAARLMDMLEDAGVIGAGQGSKPRDVLMTSSNNTPTESSSNDEDADI
jgi:S-DNA-T family DNA segregation ATPase FtsK/SpoIIIE